MSGTPVLRWIALLATTLLLASGASAQTPAKGFGLPGIGAKAAKAEPTDSTSVVKAELVQAADAAAPGGDLLVAVQLNIAPGWHVWSHATQANALPGASVFDGAIFSSLNITPADGALALRGTQWPAPKAAKADLGDGPSDYAVYEGSVTVYARIGVAKNAGGSVKATLTLSLQACNERNCLAPGEIELPVTMQVQPGVAPATTGAAFAGFDPAKLVMESATDASPSGAPTAGDDGTIRFDFFGNAFTIDPRGLGILLVLVVAFFGGMLLNFTPCVLPVIPLKIMSLSAAAGDRARCLQLGLVMSAGVVAFWIVLGLLVGGLSDFTTSNQLFQYPLFTIGLGLFIAVMAFGMAGFFSVNLPQWVHSIDASHETMGGSFVMGIMTAVLSTPCTAPLMGAAAGWAAASGSLATVLTVFGTIGAGMAAPYALLSAFPQMARRMPRSGPASEVVKQVMGLLLMAAAAFFIGAGVNGWLPVPSMVHWWIVGGFGVAAGLWMAWRTVRITRSLARRAVYGGLGLLMAVVSAGVTRELGMDHGRIAWVRYSAQALEQARHDGRVVLLDFTAEWCLNCKALEKAVLDRTEVAAAISQPGVTALKVDITSRSSDGWNLLHAYDRVSIPLLVVQKADGTVTLKSDAYTPEQVLTALKQATAK